MAGLAPKLPLARDTGDGFALIKDVETMIRQNLKMLLLTAPGERIMNPEYGVGVKQFLFAGFNENVHGQIDGKIKKQVSIYMPFVQIIEILFSEAGLPQNQLGLSIRYAIPRIGVVDLLEFTI